MAEVVLGLVIDTVVPLLVQEAKLSLRGVHGEVTKIIDELRAIQCFVKDADEKAEKETPNQGAQTWVKEFREVAYEIEDVIDTYVLHMATKEQSNHFHHKLLGSVERAMCWVFRLRPRHEMVQEIIQVKEKIQVIRERSQSYGFISSSSSSSQGEGSSRSTESEHDPRVISLFIKDAEVVGIERHRDRLIERLVHGESKRVVISLVGTGGLGKTTLAKKVYDSQIVTDHFSNKAWITVSRSFKVEELLRRTLKEYYKESQESPPPQLDSMEETQLIKELQQYLSQKTYLVVFDDVWDLRFWTIMHRALPDDSQGSRVLITTRDKDVASTCKLSSSDWMYELEPLPEEKGVELFCNKVFYLEREGGGSLTSELEQLSRSIVRRCEGLPLAIVAIAGMFSNKRRDVLQWQELERNLGTELQTNPLLSDMKWILSLSYQDLPYYLRPCLMYLGMFPEDFSIRRERLIRLWIAEGFVKEVRGKTAEQVATEYLIQLINRSLIQLSRVSDQGTIREVRVHDLMREIMLSKSEELHYAQVWEDDDDNTRYKRLIRRVSIHGDGCIDDSFLESAGKFGTRSLSVFCTDNFTGTTLQKLMGAFKLLKVVDLEGAAIDFLPDKVGDLFHLRYLGLRHTKTKELPNSIGKLHNLQTLDIKFTLIHDLPTGIRHLHNLRYLVGYNYDYESDLNGSSRRGLKFKRGLGRLKNLQKLHIIEANPGIEVIRKLSKLKQLRKLGISKLATQDGKILCETIASMSQLESLSVSAEEDETLDLQCISTPPQYLQRLYLIGRLERVPDWIPKLKNLVTVFLMGSRLMTNTLDILQDLPKLVELALWDAFLDEEVVFRATGFQTLKILKLYYMSTMTKLAIEQGALPRLELLKIGPITRFNTVPSDIYHLKNLAALSFYDVPKEFAAKLLPEEGPDFWVVEHIKPNNVRFYNRMQGQGECYKTYTLKDLMSNRNH